MFCDILKGAALASFVYQDDICFVIMDIKPINPGHVLVIPNVHAESMINVEPQVMRHMMSIAQNLSISLRYSSVQCDGINLFLCDGVHAGQDVFHLHLHVIPRFQNDGYCWNMISQRDYQRKDLDDVAHNLKEVYKKLFG